MTSVWHPLRGRTFRELLIADVVSDIGTFMQSVGSAWLMVSLGASPLLVALTQVASTLPFFLISLPAGAVGDIVDRRKLILYCEGWMLVVALVLAITTLAGVITPWLLLGLTFALSAGDAAETPTWRVLLHELVSREDLPAASALNAIEFNIARAIGPVLAGLLIASAGVGTAFIVNVVSFAGVIVVVARWRRSRRLRSTPIETVGGATVAAIRYVRNAPVVRGVMLRTGSVMFCASAVFALLPLIAHKISPSALDYGVLLGSFGAGAVAGGAAIREARSRWSLDGIVSAAVVILGAAIMTMAAVEHIVVLVVVMFTAGAAWLMFLSTTSAVAHTLAPDWVQARLSAVFILITQGALAAGSVTWGALASRFDVGTALAVAGAATIVTAIMTRGTKLPQEIGDVTPWSPWRPPVLVAAAPRLEDGPVLVTVEYDIASEHRDHFLRALDDYGRIRRRDGASRWGIFRDLERPDRYVETFVITSWAEHLRQHERLTRTDHAVVEGVRRHLRAEPEVRHLIHPTFQEQPQ